jgi:hypothetical protein
MKLLVECARSEKLARLEGIAKKENVKMLGLAREFGFSIDPADCGPGTVRMALKLEPA